MALGSGSTNARATTIPLRSSAPSMYRAAHTERRLPLPTAPRVIDRPKRRRRRGSAGAVEDSGDGVGIGDDLEDAHAAAAFSAARRRGRGALPRRCAGVWARSWARIRRGRWGGRSPAARRAAFSSGRTRATASPRPAGSRTATSSYASARAARTALSASSSSRGGNWYLRCGSEMTAVRPSIRARSSTVRPSLCEKPSLVSGILANRASSPSRSSSSSPGLLHLKSLSWILPRGTKSVSRATPRGSYHRRHVPELSHD